MSEYFTPPDDVVAGVRARSTKINEVIQSVEDGFDALPVGIATTLDLLIAGSGVRISADDTIIGVLDGKLVAGEGIEFTVNSPGGNETMTVTAAIQANIHAATAKATPIDADEIGIVDTEDSNALKKVLLSVLKTYVNTSPTLTDSVLTGTQYTVNAIGDLGGGTDDIDWSLGDVVTATVSTATQTFTASNWPTSGTMGGGLLILTNGGSQTVNFPSGSVWVDGTPPTLTIAGIDWIGMVSYDAGTTVSLFVIGLDVKAAA